MRWITLSERIYGVLLMLYPVDYRQEYGRHMRQVFRDMLRDKYRRQGVTGVLLWWCKTLLDLALTVIEQRRKIKFTMSKSTFAQFTGILLVIGGAFGGISAFGQLEPNLYHALFLLLAPAYLFIGLGCISLGMRYEQTLSTVEQWILYLCGIGGVIMAVGVVVMSTQITMVGIWLGGLYLHTVALTLFGGMHLRKPFLPIFRALPLQIAAGWWVLILGFPELFPQPAETLLAFLFWVGVGLAWLGIGLRLNQQQKEAAAATA